MDKRKIKITKSCDGKTTITRNKFGSSYKKESILLRTSTIIDNVNDINTEEFNQNSKDSHDPIKLIEDIERRIFKFLKKNNLPTKGTTKPIINCLYYHLMKNYDHVIGAYQAALCLKEINTCKQHLENNDYRKGMAHSLRLVDAFSKFIFSTLEPTLALGKSHQEGMIGKNTKLSNEEYDQCFKYFESLEKTKDGTRKLGKGTKWDYTKQYALEQFGVIISTQSLSKAYKS